MQDIHPGRKVWLYGNLAATDIASSPHQRSGKPIYIHYMADAIRHIHI